MNKEKERLKLTFPVIPPYKPTGDYAKSKATVANLKLPSYEWDIPRTDPEVKLVDVLRKFEQYSQELERKREFYKQQRVNLDAQWKDLQTRELMFKKNFEDMNSFVKSNEAKRTRAVQRQSEDHETRLERVTAIEKLQESLAEIYNVKALIETEISRHKLFENFLNNVAGASEEFKCADDFIYRFDSLSSTRNELAARQNEFLRNLETARAKTAKMVEDFSFRLIGLNNVVANLHARYQLASREAFHWESIVWHAKLNGFQKYREITEVKQACYNMYKLMCWRKNELQKIPENDFEGQLSYIKRTLAQLKLLREQAEEFKKPVSSMTVQSSKGS